MDAQRPILRRAQLEELIGLRHRVLRSGLPRDSAIFAGDELRTTRHFGAFLAGQTICCATFHASKWEDQPAWQLRGMASDEAVRGKGVGRQLLEFAERSLCDESPVRQLWANARVPALRFYQSLGWEVVSEVFDVPTAGPHVRIARQIQAELSQ